jgi:hypothetical protein
MMSSTRACASTVSGGVLVEAFFTFADPQVLEEAAVTHSTLPGALVLIAVAALTASACGTDSESAPSSARSSTSAAETPATSTPSTSTPITPGDSISVTLEGPLPQGEPPRIAYLEDGKVIVYPDGSTRPAAHPYYLFTVTGDLVAGLWFGDGRFIDVDQGSRDVFTEELGELANLAVSPSGESIAWGTPSGDIRTAWDGGQFDVASDTEALSVMAMLGRGDCEEETADCAVFYSPLSGANIRYVSADGLDSDEIPSKGLIIDVSVTGDLAAFQSDQDGTCSELRSAPDYRVQWEACDYFFLRFSPDGDRILAATEHGDRSGGTQMSILHSRNGREIVTFTTPRGKIEGWTWEDEDHVLLTINDDQGWRVVRVGVDGSAETALVADGGGSDTSDRPWTLAIRPS